MEKENEIVEEETTEEETSDELDELLDEESSDEEESEDTDDGIDWKERAIKAEKSIEFAKKKGKNKKPTNLQPKAKESEDDDKVSDRLSNLEKSEEKRQFGHEHNLSPEETDKIFAMNPKPTADTLKDPFIKAGLEAIRRDKRVDANTPSSSAKSKVLDTKEFKELSPEAKNVAFQEYLKSKVPKK